MEMSLQRLSDISVNPARGAILEQALQSRNVLHDGLSNKALKGSLRTRVHIDVSQNRLMSLHRPY